MNTRQLAAISFVFTSAFCSAQPAPDPLWQSYRAHIAAAGASMRLGESADTRRWLEGAPTQYRNWEWHHLNATSNESLTSFNAGSPVSYIALSPDGKTIAATSTTGGTISLFNASDMAPIATLEGHTATVYKVRFSKDGAFLASASQDRTARLWDVTKRQSLLTYSGHKFPVTTAIFTSGGTHVLTSSYQIAEPQRVQGVVHLWKRDTGELVRTFTGGKKPVSDLALSPDGARIYAGTWDSAVYAWDTDTPTDTPADPVQTFEAPHSPGGAVQVNGICLSADGAFLYAAMDAKCIHVWDTASAELLTTLSGHTEEVNAVALSPDGKTLATAGTDDVIRLWDAATKAQTAVLRAHTSAVQMLAWSPDGSRLFSASLDKTIRAWDPSPARYGDVRFSHGTSNYATGFSPDGTRLVTCGADRMLSIFDTHSGARLAHWSAHQREICRAAFSPDGARVLSCSWDGTARIFDAATQKELHVASHTAGVALASWSPDGMTFATACNDKKVHVWNAKSGQPVRALEGHGGAVTDARYSPDGARLASCARDGSIRVWDPLTGTAAAEMKAPAGVHSVAFTPEGRTLVTGGEDGAVRLWDAATGKQLRLLHQADVPVYCVDISPDGTRVAAAAEHLVIIDLPRGGEVLTLRPTTKTIWALSFSPDGKRLAVTSWGGEVVILDTVPVRQRAS